VLFTSGYTDNAIIHHGRLDDGVLLLSKPYRKSLLANMVRVALGDTTEAGWRRPVSAVATSASNAAAARGNSVTAADRQ
jgi:hypothetical protein